MFHLRFLTLTAISIVAVVSTALGQTPVQVAVVSEIPQWPVIRVTGTATATANPDLVQLYVAVESRGTNAQRTANENAKAVASVLAALRSRLGAGSAITTASYSLDPVYNYVGDRSESVFGGFVARNLLKVETSDLNSVGAILDTAVASGANNVNAITFTLKDQTQIRTNALGDAARQARTKAEALATAMGLRLGGIRMIEERTSLNPRIDGIQYDRAESQTPIKSGPVEVRADVTISFDIVQ